MAETAGQVVVDDAAADVLEAVAVAVSVVAVAVAAAVAVVVVVAVVAVAEAVAEALVVVVSMTAEAAVEAGRSGHPCDDVAPQGSQAATDDEESCRQWKCDATS